MRESAGTQLVSQPFHGVAIYGIVGVQSLHQTIEMILITARQHGLHQ